GVGVFSGIGLNALRIPISTIEEMDLLLGRDEYARVRLEHAVKPSRPALLRADDQEIGEPRCQHADRTTISRFAGMRSLVGVELAIRPPHRPAKRTDHRLRRSPAETERAG